MTPDRPYHILAVDDDPDICDVLTRYFSAKGYRVTTAAAGETGLQAMREEEPVDLVILDVNLPDIDGFEICRRLRARSMVPIIMLTGESAETDRVVGLEIGADDYVAKPFSARELEARVKSVLRRVEGAARAAAETEGAAVYRFAGWCLDLERRQLSDPDGKDVGLTGLEYRLLVAFAEHPQRVLSRDQLMNLTKGRDALAFDRSIDVQVGRLRKKLRDQGKNPRFIKTFRGEGYVFAIAVERGRQA